MNSCAPVTHQVSRGRLASFGLWLKQHQRTIHLVQWFVVGIYAILLIVPVLVPLPDGAAHIWDNITVFAQFVFWGIWWPGVLISMLIFGRLWCGVFCPEGALTALASRHGRGKIVPRWMRWRGWPFTAFVLTTVYGQLISVYQYPEPALVILGGSTVAAMLVGYLYGRDKRVWCRYLCPVSGVFGLLSKLAPMHYSVDRTVWDAYPAHQMGTQSYNCEPLVPVKTMESASPCHMCGRCAGFRDAVSLQPRSANSEIVEVSGRTATLWDSLLIITGLIGVVIGAFQWSASPWFISLKLTLATYLIEADFLWPLQTSLPTWILTNYPDQGDVLTIVDGVTMLIYMFASACILSLAIAPPLALASKLAGVWDRQRFYHLSHALIPIAASGVILGLSSQTLTLLQAEGLGLGWVPWMRIIALAGSEIWSVYLAYRILQRQGACGLRLAGAVGLFILATIPPMVGWVLLFWIW